MSIYNIEIEDNVMSIGFGETPAQNDELVKDVDQQLDAMIQSGKIVGGEIMRINGRASLPIAMAIAAKLKNRYQAIACYDPKLCKYIVSLVLGNKYEIGELLD